jgi:hypothetical protein
MRGAPSADERADLQPLSALADFEVSPGDPDVRGWPVLGPTGKGIGRVGELLVDRSALKVRYLELILDGAEGSVAATRQRRVLIPIGAADLDDEHDLVRLRHHPESLDRLPTYEGALTRDQERSTCEALAAGLHRAEPGGDIYTHPLYDSDRFYAARRKRAQLSGRARPHGPEM